MPLIFRGLQRILEKVKQTREKFQMFRRNLLFFQRVFLVFEQIIAPIHIFAQFLPGKPQFALFSLEMRDFREKLPANFQAESFDFLSFRVQLEDFQEKTEALVFSRVF